MQHHEVPECIVTLVGLKCFVKIMKSSPTQPYILSYSNVTLSLISGIYLIRYEYACRSKVYQLLYVQKRAPHITLILLTIK